MGMVINPELCVRCKGKNLCGRPCYFIESLKLKAERLNLKKHEMLTSPPSVFIGRFGYPNVSVGALGIFRPPPQPLETTTIKDDNPIVYDSPKEWFSKGFGVKDVLEKRLGLINSIVNSNVKIIYSKNRILHQIQEMAMATNPVDSEVIFRKKPKIEVKFSYIFSPLGLSAPIEKINVIDNPKVDRRVEKIVYDYDLLSTDGVIELYRKGIDENYITRIFSTGLLGLKNERRLVPTRWSITAVDDIIGKNLLNDIRTFDIIDTNYLFYSEYNGNRFWVLLIPSTWRYELIEVTHNISIWGRENRIYITKDFEDYYGRKRYVEETAGGYYAARLGVLEYLYKIKRQATVLIVREILPDYWAPLGVWLVRETVRDAMRKEPKIFDTIDEAVVYITKEMKADAKLFQISRILKKREHQMLLRKFVL
jgi:hypothetical protein